MRMKKDAHRVLAAFPRLRRAGDNHRGIVAARCQGRGVSRRMCTAARRRNLMRHSGRASSPARTYFFHSLAGARFKNRALRFDFRPRVLKLRRSVGAHAQCDEEYVGLVSY